MKKAGKQVGKYINRSIKTGIKYSYESGVNTSSKNPLPKPKINKQIKR